MDKKQGKKNRESGKRFELKVRADLEKQGYIVDRWTNQVELIELGEIHIKNMSAGNLIKGDLKYKEYGEGKLVSCRPKFNPFTKSLMMNSGGMPDFIAFKVINSIDPRHPYKFYEVIGVECKGGDQNHKYLDKEEKEKCRWLLNNNVFSRILIAQKGIKRGQIIYTEFENGN